MVGICQVTKSHHNHCGQKPTMVGICHGGNVPVSHEYDETDDENDEPDEDEEADEDDEDEEDDDEEEEEPTRRRW
jgi:hypothetical protein